MLFKIGFALFAAIWLGGIVWALVMGAPDEPDHWPGDW